MTRVLPPADGRLLQRVRSRFLLLAFVAAGIALLDLLRIDTVVSLPGYLASVGVMVVWAFAMYRRAERWPWLDVVGPVAVAGIGIAAGDYDWAFAAMYGSLFLHGTYGGRLRTSVAAVMYVLAYEVAVVVTHDVATMFAGIASHVVGVAIVLSLVRRIASSVRLHDETRDREAVFTRTSAELLTATDPDDVARIALTAVVEVVAGDGSPHRVSLWRHRDDALEMSALAGRELTTALVPFELLPADLLEAYRSGVVVVLEPDRMVELQRSMEVEAEFRHGLSVPLRDGGRLNGLLFVATSVPLGADTVVALERFMHEVSLADVLVRRQALLGAVVDNSADGIVLVGRDGTIEFASPSVTRLAGVDAGSFVGRPLGELLARRVDGELVPLSDLGAVDGSGIDVVAGSGDTARQVELTVSPVDDDAAVLNLRDITERRRLEDEITYRAFHDPVTGLANRGLFADRVEHAVARAERDGSRVAVALIDLDDFKGINDVHGHSAGDQLLVETARRVSAALRRSDTCARFGGDEFAILMEGVADDAEVEAVLGRVVEALRRPFAVGQRQVAISASAGLRVGTAEDAGEVLVADADVAMYVAKAQGKNQLVRFEAGMRMAALERLELRSELQTAIDDGQLVLHYQPIVDLGTGELSGFEALVRWDHPERGMVAPDRFISVAEETGLIIPLGRWVLREACGQLADWHGTGTVHPGIRMSVNLSAHQLLSPRIVDDVVTILEETGVRPQQLTLEVTETALMGEPERAGEVLSALGALGVAVAIDDFGTGYSSLAYLQRFPVDVIKVDRSFVSRVAEGPEQAALAHAIVKLAQTLRIATVAEGVEEQAQSTILRDWGCSHGQGWWWGRAMPVAAVGDWLAERRLAAPAPDVTLADRAAAATGII